MTNSTQEIQNATSQTASNAVVAATRFLQAAWHRKQYVIAALAVSALLGAVYYLTATRVYQGKASLLVTQTGADVWNTSMSAEGGFDGLMPTCERLITSAVVLNDAVRRIAQLPLDKRVDFRSYPREEWAERLWQEPFGAGLAAKNLIEVTYNSQDPRAAERVVGAVVDSYLSFMQRNHKDVSVEVVKILNRERLELEEDLLAKQRQHLQIKRNVRDLGLREGTQIVHPTVQRVSLLNDQLVEAQKERVRLEASLAAVRVSKTNGGDMRYHLMAVDPQVGQQLISASLGITSQDVESVRIVERKMIEDRAQLDTLSAHYGPRHPRVAQLHRGIYLAEQFLADHHAKIDQRLSAQDNQHMGTLMVSLIEQRLLDARFHEEKLREQYTATETEAVQLNDRLAELQIAEDELKRLQGVHTSLLNRITSIDIDQNRADVRIAVVSEPRASDRPVSPRLVLAVLFCLLAGLGSGAAIVYVLGLFDDRFRTPEELGQQTGAPVLAMIRKLPNVEGTGAESLQVHVAPQATESEAFRTLRTTLAFSGESLERLVVTSSEPGDGKTTVLANLAVTLAQAGKRTLLIDADLRRPGLSKLFDVRGREGLSQVLRSDEHFADLCRRYIQPTGIDNLDVLPCGYRPADPAELLGGPRTAGLVAWAEDTYDQVLIDCPPILAASDAAVLGRLADGVLLVVQPGKNRRRTVLRAADELARLRVNLVGVVVNRVDEQQDGGYFGFGAGYGYGYGYGYKEDDGDEPNDAEGSNAGAIDHDRGDDQTTIRRRAA